MINFIFSFEHLIEIREVIAKATDMEVLVHRLPMQHMQLMRCYVTFATNAPVDHHVGAT